MNSVVIYLRTSTAEQNPENQLNYCEGLNKFGDANVIIEQQSAFKDYLRARPKFYKILEQIKKRQIKHLIVWGFDRIYRNRKKLAEFFEICKIYECKIHSHRQKWFEDIHKIPQPWNELMLQQLIFILGWIAEEESKKRSERVKAAVEKGDITRSKYGNKWGRKQIELDTGKIIFLAKRGLSYRDIANEIIVEGDHGEVKHPSYGTIANVLKNYKLETAKQNQKDTKPNLGDKCI